MLFINLEQFKYKTSLNHSVIDIKLKSEIYFSRHVGMTHFLNHENI